MKPQTDIVLWCLKSGRHGDNVQVEVLGNALADRLGVHPVFKEISFNGFAKLPNQIASTSTLSLTADTILSLQAPWPDVLITVGGNIAPAARWIQLQAGGKTKLIHIGNPSAPHAWFDLIVTSTEQPLTLGENVLTTDFPMTFTPAEQQQLDHWRAQFEYLPKPWLAVLVGGSTKRYMFDEHAIEKLALWVTSWTKRTGGSSLISTSPRTGKNARELLRQNIGDSGFFFDWNPACNTVPLQNPHRSIVGLADEFIVTGESMSMLAEACKTGRPVAVLALNEHPAKRLKVMLRHMFDVFKKDITKPKENNRLISYFAQQGRCYWADDSPNEPTDKVVDDIDTVAQHIVKLINS